MIQRGAIFGINHLLEQNEWAAMRLAPSAGCCLLFRGPPLPELRLAITDAGRVEAAPADCRADLTVTVKPAMLPLFLSPEQSVRARALRDAEIAGNAELAAIVQELARELRWDAEEDLSRVVGDLAAHRIAGAVRSFASAQREAGLRVAQNFAEYWTVEQPLIARADDIAQFGADVTQLRDDLERLEQRVERLSRR